MILSGGCSSDQVTSTYTILRLDLEVLSDAQELELALDTGSLKNVRVTDAR